MYRLFEERKSIESTPLDSTFALEKSDAERSLCCVVCHNFITQNDFSIEIQNNHLHSFVNPQGLLYEIACFETAPGVMVVGEPTFYWTWFIGYSWQILYCKECKNHLGWKFNGDKQFYAIIRSELINCPVEDSTD